MLSVNGSGFKVNGKWYYINDVLKYPNTSIKRIILFGFYDNEQYEDNDCGCGFYTATVGLIGNENWIKNLFPALIGILWEKKKKIKIL